VDTLTFIFNPSYFPHYFKIFAVLIIICFGGIAIFSLIYSTKNKLIIVGGGAILGFLTFLLLLGLASYLVKGEIGIRIIFLLYIITSAFAFTRNKNFYKHLFNPRLSINSILLIGLILVNLAFLFLFIRDVILGSSAPLYWGIALSFARGNYPTVLPWQPEFLSAYHQGSMMVMGAIQSLTSTHISIIHSSLSFYLISSIFLFLTGIAREKTRSLLCLLPGLTATVLIGGPVIFIGNAAKFLQTVVSFPLLTPHAWQQATYFLDYSSFSLWLGTGVTSLHTLIYNIYHSSAWAAFILFLVLFLLIQNSVRDSLLSPSHQMSRFRLANVSEFPTSAPFSYLTGSPKLTNLGMWFLPNFLILAITTCLFSFAAKSVIPKYLVVSSTISAISSLLIVETFFPTNSVRFANYAYHMIFLALVFVLTEFLAYRRRLYQLLGFIVVILVFIPQLITTYFPFVNRAIFNQYDSFTDYLMVDYPAFRWFAKNVPYDKRIIVIDEYPFDKPSLTPAAVESYGLFIPTSPPGYKVHLPETGLEWFDAITTLNPSTLKKLKIDYVFIKNGEEKRFSKIRQSQLKDSSLFTPKLGDTLGTLFEVSSEFKQKADDVNTIENIIQKIPDNSNVYIGLFKAREIRRGAALELKRRVTLYGPAFADPYVDWFVKIETSMPQLKDTTDKVQYFLLDKETLPVILTDKKAAKMMDNDFAVLWKTMD